MIIFALVAILFVLGELMCPARTDKGDLFYAEPR